MNLALDHYADNPVIDEIVCWPPKAQKMKSIRACLPIFRKPFIEIEMEDGEIMVRHFLKPSFDRHWAEAMVILETICDIELQSDFQFEPYRDRETLAKKVLATRQECITESNLMYDANMFEQFLYQYGEDCRGLPDEVEQRIVLAKESLKSEGSAPSVE